ncbi:MAG: hypothetical protein JKX94_11780, partial [Sneathiella sp.]|nr:hypothetical protein [Sneathiella sp.]
MATDENEPKETADNKVLPDDPIVTYILNAVANGKDVSPNHIAQKIASDRAKDTA